VKEEPEFVAFNIGTGRGTAEVVRWNEKTVIVKMRRAGKTKHIKRHIVKDHVVLDQ